MSSFGRTFQFGFCLLALVMITACGSVDDLDSEHQNVSASDDRSSDNSEADGTGPVLGVIPGNFEPITLMQGESTEHTLQLANLGNEQLTYRISYQNPKESEVKVSSNSDDSNSSSYAWRDSVDGIAIYSWQDIYNKGTPITFADDSVLGPFELGFDFEFYGNSYNQIWLNSNGLIGFSPESINSAYSNQSIPNSDANNNMIAWLWDDLSPRDGYRAEYVSHNGSFIFQLSNYGQYGDVGIFTAQVILNANGTIKIQYQSFSDDFNRAGATVGIENEDGTDGLQVVMNNQYLHDELAIEFSNGPQWLSLSQSSGEIEPDASENITLTFDSSGQTAGTYEAELHIISNDSSQSDVVIPLSMDVVSP